MLSRQNGFDEWRKNVQVYLPLTVAKKYIWRLTGKAIPTLIIYNNSDVLYNSANINDFIMLSLATNMLSFLYQ